MNKKRIADTEQVVREQAQSSSYKRKVLERYGFEYQNDWVIVHSNPRAINFSIIFPTPTKIFPYENNKDDFLLVSLVHIFDNRLNFAVLKEDNKEILYTFANNQLLSTQVFNTHSSNE